MSHRIGRTARLLVLGSSLLLLACGPSVEGVYSGEGTGFLQKIEFRDDDKVELTFMGMTREGTYEIDDDRVKINNGGEVTILRIADDGCLDGGGILGRYCKVGDSDVAASGVVGSSFAAGPAGDEIVIEFPTADEARMTVDGQTETAPYEVDGDEITLETPQGEMLLKRRGNDLEGTAEGVTIVFKKRGW